MSPALSDIASFFLSFSTGVLTILFCTRVNGMFSFSFLRTKIEPACAFLALRGEAVKMTLVVRKDLKMGVGKIAAQCAHAAVAVSDEIHTHRAAPAEGGGVEREWVRWYDAWVLSGRTKVALQCEGEEKLMECVRAARREKVPHALIRDAGRTQVAAGSKTVLAIGPAPVSIVDRITGGLKLL